MHLFRAWCLASRLPPPPPAVATLACTLSHDRLCSELGYSHPRACHRRNPPGEPVAGGVARSQGRGGIGVRAVRRVLLSRFAHAGGHDGRYPRSGDFYGGYGYRGGHVRDDRAHSAGRDGGKC